MTYLRLAAALLATACLLVAVDASRPLHAVETADSGLVVALDERVSVLVPADMTHEQRSLGARGDMLTLADGSDVMILVVYRKDGADKAPTPTEALEVHVDELERALGPATRQAAKRRVLGRDQAAVTLALTRDGVARDAWVVAFEAGGRTIVVSAVMVRGSPNETAMSSVLKGIRVQ